MKYYPEEKTYGASLTRVTNTGRGHRENVSYFHLRVRGENFLFTRDQMFVAAARAKNQPEDLRRRNLFQRLFIDWWK